MKSMTGYGRQDYQENGIKLTVEVKTVNNRYLDLNCKYPRSFVCMEDTIRKAVQSKVSRGRVDLFLTYVDERETDANVTVDYHLASGYVGAVQGLQEKFGLSSDAADLMLSSLLKSGDVVKQEAQIESAEFLRDTVETLVFQACDKLNEMRAAEGEKLVNDMLSRVDFIDKTVSEIELRAPMVAEEYREKLRAKVEEYVGGKVDEGRLLSEVALFADKSNIDEELTRLHSHVSQFRKIVKSDGGGRKLDFLIQEFNREANTICSKASDVTITDKALALKCEIEKIREQVQNLE